AARATPTPSQEATDVTTRQPEPSAEPVDQTELDRRLIEAAWAGDVDRARRLVALGADVNAQDDTQQSAFLIATSEGYDDLLALTLRHGADVDARDSFDGTGLIRAAERGHWRVVGRLVRAGVRLDHVNNLGWTALHEAVTLGDGSRRYVDTVRILVAAGVDVAIRASRDGRTAVETARARGFGAIADLLSRAAQGERGSLDGDADAVALALRHDADIESRDAHDRTPLLLAVTEDRVDTARLLVALGADPDALDDRHDTPWLVTGVTGSVPMVEVLLPAHPDLTIRNRFGGTSVIPASERGHVDYVRRVVRTGIDVNHVNDLGWTALLEAVILGDGTEPYQEIVRILLDAGADPAIADHDGATALQHAEARGQSAVASLLRG
ncbi:MAG TPA: ankyrin repeat domain-containing protein, partial [Nocardioides sp.]|uniref:ankyrin repeat domain-containing protein n=1 Tax=Nocardioides sp. TaxID=35761 RepID=UPI002E335011